MQTRTRPWSGLWLALLLAAPGIARADIVWLENGGKIEGEIIREGDSEVEIKGIHGTVVLRRDEIKKIEKRLAPEKELEARREKLAPDDVAGRIELAQFVLEKRLPSAKAGELAIEAWGLAPHDGPVLELLKKKLDYKFDAGAWAAPESWYPAHGYVRHASSWITLEQAAYLDAETATKQARTEAAAADKAVSQGEKEAQAALEAEGVARREVARIKGILDSIDIKVTAAQTDLASKNSDLGRAQDQTALAQRDYTYLSTLPTPSDAKQADDLGKRVNTALSLLTVAQSNEQRARRARDAAQGDLNDLIDLKAEGPKRLGVAQGALDAALARGKAAREALPVLREATGQAKKRIEECRAAELTAKSVAADRRAQELKADADRDEALKSWKADSPAPTAPAPGK